MIGSFAFSLYAHPRYTKDIDILIEPSKENAERLLGVLCDFGFGSLGLTEADFTEEGQIIQLGYEPLRVDLITSIPGLDFREIWETLNQQKYGTQDVWFISMEHLIEAKKISNRPQDKADLDVLLKIQARKESQ